MADKTNNEQFTEALLDTYTKYFGSITADNYKRFYQDKDIKTVLLSAQELLTEYKGEKEGKAILTELKHTYKIN